MMRGSLPVLCTLAALNGVAQVPYGNEWIDHARQYWRFQVHAEGLYRIDSLALAASGFPIASVDPAHLMLFSRERQVPIYVEGGADGTLNAGDFIEFFAQGNDGWFDARLYDEPDQQANPYYSLFNDSIRYYLTWDPDPQVEKLRIHPYVNTNFTAYTAAPWCWGESLFEYHNLYQVGPNGTQGASSGFYGPTEGWMRNNPINSTTGTAEVAITVATPQFYNGVGAPPMRVHTLSASLNNPGGATYADHHLQVAYGPAPGIVAFDTIWNGWGMVRGSFEVPPSFIAGNIPIRFQVPHDLFGPNQVGIAQPSYADRQTISHIRVRYPRKFNMQNQVWNRVWLPDPGAVGISYMDMTNVNGTPVLYAYGDTVRRILPTFLSNRWKALVPVVPGTPETEAFVHSLQAITSITALQPVNGTGSFTDFAAVQADSALIIVTHADLMAGAAQYKQYREIEAPPERRMNTVVVDVDELYDQFGGGIVKNGAAIRFFTRYVLDTWGSDPRALLLIGKSVQAATYLGSVGYRHNGSNAQIAASAPAFALCKVPSFGHPSSDPCLTIGLRGDPRVMEVPVGRISANDNAQVEAYLNKVRAFEAQPPAAWMKNILHFRGGFTSGENALFALYQGQMKAIAEDTCFGGRVITFAKNSSDIFQQAAADSVRMFIEEGVTLMNFFAHAYSQNFDITIDDPANYQWNGRHPLVIGNSCYIGNMHLNNNLSTGEQWVLMPEKGPIGFLSTVDLGFAMFLAEYSREFYNSFSRLNYGEGIGEHMRHAVFTQLSFSGIERQNNAHTFSLQGDPTLVLNSWPQPDYVVTLPDVVFDPAVITADADTFRIKVAITNIGKAVNEGFNVAMQRTYGESANPQQLNLLTTMPHVHYRDTAVFQVPTLAGSGGQGLNLLQVRVDLDPDQVDELEDVANNTINTNFFVTSGDIRPVYPYDFAIVPEPNPTLKASTGDPFAPVRTYIFQIDTTDLFNSPVREQAILSAPGGVVSWQPQSIYALNATQDSTVFYWRCSLDSTGNGGYNWYERSFQYIPGKHGWGQAHYFQFKNDTYSGVVYDRPERDFEFNQAERNLIARVRGGVSSNDTGWQLDLQPMDYNGCSAQPAWHVVVVDPANFTPWGTYWMDPVTGVEFNVDHQFNNHNNGSNCRDEVETQFLFRTNNPTELEGMRAMLQDAVPDGHHLLVYTWRHLDKAGTNANAPALLPLLESFGAPSFSTLQDSVPYIMYVRKGDPTTFQDTIASTLNEFLVGSFWVEGFSRRGGITTMKAGPAHAWHGLHWNERPDTPGDSTVIRIIGVTPTGVEMTLFEWPSVIDSVPDLGQYVDAAQYPMVRIQGEFFDPTAPQARPAQIERWQLLSSPVPECAIDPPLGYWNELDGLFQGQTAAVAVAIHNISEFDMDSLLVEAKVTDRNNLTRRVHYKLNAPLPAGGVLMDTVRFSTWGLGGVNTIVIEANPIDTLTGRYHQPEQYHFNNIAVLRFNVDTDRENPLLDVTFDGVHIMDGDIVSARPEIEITLDDENQVLIMDAEADTSLFKVFLQGPGLPLTRIFFRDGSGAEVMRFLPASGPENKARILYHPVFATDGKYTLTVQARDLSSNNSGDNDLRISFEVINRPTITEVLNYPNPFTTSTRFVFTVTGSEPPTYMKVQILTAAGRVVREIGMHELGPVRVGRNITEFAWDGTDQFGDRLARGVYLYKVIAKLHGQDIEYRETSASGFFHKGYGKMYLLR